MSEWTAGDRVRIVRGPFADFRGTVRGRDGQDFVVDVEIFDRTTPVLLGVEDIGPAGRGDDGGDSSVREPRPPQDPAGGAAEARRALES